MVMLSSTLRGRVLKFVSAAIDPKACFVSSFEGEDAISKLPSYTIDLVSKDPKLDTAAMVQQPAVLAIKQGVATGGPRGRGIQTLQIHGVLSAVELLGQGAGWVSYRAFLTSPLWRLSLRHHSRIFLDKSIPEILEDVLKTEGIAADQYELRLSRAYPKREYVMQYQESDLNFLRRLLEHEGIFFFSEYSDEGGKVVFGDSTSAVKPIQGEPSISFRPNLGSSGGTGDWFDSELVWDLVYSERAIPAEVVLQDYNYRTPSVDLKVAEPVVPDGFGTHYEYGSHYKDASEGKVYAQIRAEEFRCQKRKFEGQGNGRAFRAGGTFTLVDHFRPDFNIPHLITSVRHKGSQALDLSGGANRALAKYSNKFESIPADVPFRPPRVTPKSKITGVMTAKIDASGDGKYAELDDQGRYKVILPLDLSGKKDGTASRWIRKAEPYTGPDYGIHFPLHKGAEVILTHIDGDPDRPIIVNAVPNPETGSPVKGANQSQCAIRTGGGNELVIEDSDGGQQIRLHSPHSGTTMTMGAPGSPPGFALKTGANLYTDIAVDEISQIGANSSKSVAGNTSESTAGAKDEKVDGLFTLGVGGYATHVFKAACKKMVAGDWLDVALGPKISFVNGVSVESVLGAKLECDAAMDLNSVGAAAMKKLGAWLVKSNSVWIGTAGAMMMQKSPSTTVSGSGLAVLKSGGSSLHLVPGVAKLETGTLHLKGGTTVIQGGAVTVRGGGDMVVAKPLKAKQNVEILGAVELKKKLDVAGAATYKANVTINKALKAAGGALKAQ